MFKKINQNEEVVFFVNNYKTFFSCKEKREIKFIKTEDSINSGINKTTSTRIEKKIEFQYFGNIGFSKNVK
jgi:hypothetical protein